MFSPPTRKATTPCSSQRAEYEKKNTEHRTSSAERRIIRWIRDGRRKEDASVYGAMRQTDSRTKTERERTTQEIHMRAKRKTPIIERRTSMTEQKVTTYMIKDANT